MRWVTVAAFVLLLFARPARAGDSALEVQMSTSYGYWLRPTSGGPVYLGADGVKYLETGRDDNPRYRAQAGIGIVVWGDKKKPFPRVAFVGDRTAKLTKKELKAIGRIDILFIDVTHPDLAAQLVAQLAPRYAVLPFAPYDNAPSKREEFLKKQQAVEQAPGDVFTIGTTGAPPKQPRVIVIDRPEEL